MKEEIQRYRKLAMFHLVPVLIYAFTFSLPLLHFTHSRVYNFRIALVELIILFIAFAIYRKDLFLHFKKQSVDTVLIYLFFASGLISTLNSDYFNHSMERYTSIIIWFSYFWLMVFLIRKKHLLPSTLIFLISISTLIPIIHLFELYSNTPNAYIRNLTNQLYYYSNVRHFGFHLTSASILSFYFLFDHKATQYKFIFGAIIIGINIFILFWTASRQGVAISIIFGISLLFYVFKKHSKRKIISIFLALSGL